MSRVKVGLIGCGFIAELHMQAYRRVYGVNVEVAAVCARGDHVVDFAKRHRIATTHRDYRALIADKTIDVIVISYSTGVAHRDGRCLHGGRQARHLREALHRVFRSCRVTQSRSGWDGAEVC